MNNDQMKFALETARSLTTETMLYCDRPREAFRNVQEKAPECLFVFIHNACGCVDIDPTEIADRMIFKRESLEDAFVHVWDGDLEVVKPPPKKRHLSLGVTALAAKPEAFDTFSRHLDEAWIEEALLATDTATFRRRRLPAEQVVWLVIGMALMRNRPIRDVVDHLDLALPASDGKRIAPSAIVQARARVGAAPLEWLFVRTADEWGHASAARHRWRGLALYGVDGTTLRVPDSDENRAFFGGQPAGDGRGDAGYPQLRLVTLMALRSHTLAAASFGPYGNDERPYAANLWSSVPNDSLTLVDRNYLAATILMPLERDGPIRAM